MFFVEEEKGESLQQIPTLEERSMKHTNSMIVLVLGLSILSVAISTSALAASPTISNAAVQLHTVVTPGISGGEVVVGVSATVEDLDGLDGVKLN